MIVFATNSSGIGGGETSFLNLFQKCQLSTQCNFIVLRKCTLWNYVESLNNPDCQRIGWSRFFLFVFKNKNKIESILLNDYFSLVTVGWFARLINIKVIWIAHGWWYRKLKLLPIYLFPNKIISVSSPVKEYYDHYSMLKNKNVYIPLGIDINKYPFSINHNNDKYIVAIIGRFQRIKNHKLFLKIAKQLLERNSTHYTFWIIGSNTFDVKDDARTFSEIVREVDQDSALKNSIRFIPHTKELQNYYSKIDFIVQPSQFESFGMVILEAMASGIIVLATNQGGPNDIITHKIDGFLIAPNDIDEYVETIIDMGKNETMRNTIALAARKKIERKFDITLIAHEYSDVIEKL